MFKWNERSVKADVFDRSSQRITREELTQKEVIDNPSGKQPEVIIMSCAKVLSELVALKEEDAQRILHAMKSIKVDVTDVNQLSFFEDKN